MNKIKSYLDFGLHVSVKDTDGDYQIISPMKDEGKYYRRSGWCDTLKKAKQYIGDVDGYEDLEEESKEWTEITPFHLDFKPYPVGMKVKVIRTGEIREIIRSYSLGYEFKGYLGTRPHYELIPVFEEEVTMTIKEIEEKLNITGLKIVE